MAEKKQTTKRAATKKSSSAVSKTKVTVKKAPVVDKKVKQKRERKLPTFLGFLRPIGAYFAGAWYELRQVRWPDRKATWGLTVAVMLFSLFFAALILGLDWVFQTLFKEILL